MSDIDNLIDDLEQALYQEWEDGEFSFRGSAVAAKKAKETLRARFIELEIKLKQAESQLEMWQSEMSVEFVDEDEE